MMFFTWIRKVFQHWFTEPDNKTLCLMKGLSATIATSGIGLQIHDVLVAGHDFIFKDFAMGAGLLLAAVGAALGLKPNSPTDTIEKKD